MAAKKQITKDNQKQTAATENEKAQYKIPFITARIDRIASDVNSKIKANASVTIGNHFAVHGIKVYDGGEKGLQVLYPGHKGTDGKFYDDFHPITKESREALNGYVEQQLKENAIDVVLSHTCPFKYEPVEEFLPGIDQSTVDDSTEKWLDVIEETTDYMAWFCGHWHTNKRIDKMHFLFHQFESSEELQKMKVNKTNLEREMEDG